MATQQWNQGWSKPLEVDIATQLPELAGALQAGYDASGIGKRSGRLRAELGNLGNYAVADKWGARLGTKSNSVRLTIRLPYARIQEFGGRVPLRVARKAKFMHYQAYGREWFIRAVRGFNLPGFHYISEHGMAEVQSRMGRIFRVKWRGK